MKVFKPTILITILLSFSFQLAKCQWGGYEGETVVSTEEAVIALPEEVVVTGPSSEETVIIAPPEETVVTEETIVVPPEEVVVVTEETTVVPTEEAVVAEETTGVEEEEEQEEEITIACPQYIEETEVDGYWMTFHPCCVSPNAQCDNTNEPVCIERVRCEDEHCRWHYETVDNVCNACKGHNNWQYSKRRCPWENGENRLRYRQRKTTN